MSKAQMGPATLWWDRIHLLLYSYDLPARDFMKWLSSLHCSSSSPSCLSHSATLRPCDFAAFLFLVYPFTLPRCTHVAVLKWQECPWHALTVTRLRPFDWSFSFGRRNLHGSRSHAKRDVHVRVAVRFSTHGRWSLGTSTPLLGQCNLFHSKFEERKRVLLL